MRECKRNKTDEVVHIFTERGESTVCERKGGEEGDASKTGEWKIEKRSETMGGGVIQNFKQAIMLTLNKKYEQNETL